MTYYEFSKSPAELVILINNKRFQMIEMFDKRIIDQIETQSDM